ncbi:MAG: transcription antitermination factor NusB [Alphaproteobacteria bacterium]
MSQEPKKMSQNPSKKIAGRHAARFAAVQALYQLSQDESLNVDRVLLQFVQHRLNDDMDGITLRDLDRGFFSELVRGTRTSTGDIDDILTGVLPEDWRVERLDTVLLALLRTATYELAFREDVPAKVILNEYVEIAKGFFSGKEPKLANGALHQIASQMRPEDIETPE